MTSYFTRAILSRLRKGFGAASPRSAASGRPAAPIIPAVPIGTAFHPRTLALCESLNYREWSGYYAVSAYETHHEHEYNAIRNAAALIDISPLFKYLISGRDAAAMVDRVITRSAAGMAPGQVIYTPWCDERGMILDDGTVSRLEEERFRWTAAEPNLRWLTQQSAGLDVSVEDVSESVAALAVQGPTSAALLRHVTDAGIDTLKYFRVIKGSMAGVPVEISRTGYTGDLGYEIWMAREHALTVWDTLVSAGPAFGLRPTGMLALDVARIEAGLLLIDVDFFSAKKAQTPSRFYTPFEIGLGRLVDFSKERFIGRKALLAERDRKPERRIAGLTLHWKEVEALYEAVQLPPMANTTASRAAVPIYQRARQIGRVTSSTWSPVLKQMIAIATIDAAQAVAGTVVEVEYTVDAVRHRVGATVTSMPFFNPSRKTAVPPIAIGQLGSEAIRQ
jgi:aminomethyltransferase